MRLLSDGQVIRDTYEVERYLGEGAFAEVYRVRHRFLGRQAMKVFKAAGITVADIEQMLEEALMLSRIGHPNIVRVFDANVLDSSRGACGFFTMEYVAGASLEQFWQSHGARFVPVPTAVEIMAQVCEGLSVAHGEDPPIVHRDIKPQNILVGYDANGLRARVSDFGLAKRVNPLTMMASAKGTLAFKAPESFVEGRGDSRASDVWAIGCTLYLLLTDRLPYPDASDLERLNGRPFGESLVPPSMVNPSVGSDLDAVLARALAYDPDQRQPTADAFHADLAACLNGGNGRSSPPSAKVLPAASSDAGKAALGGAAPADMGEAQNMVARAVELSKNAGKLTEAADLLEEALNKTPDLRDEFEPRLKLWRNGIVM